MTLASWNDGPDGGTPITADALNTRDAELIAAVKRWRPNTSYTLGEQVVSPNNDVVSAAVSHTSGATYDPNAWGLSVSFEPSLPPGTATQYLRGDRTWQTLNLDGGGADGAGFPVEVLLDPANVSGPVGAKLNIPTPGYPAGGQACHPSVLFFPESWNGYRYWMAMTPYPGGSDDFEDPCIVVSQDGITWAVPPGLTNPIDDADGQPEYNSDVDLKMGPNNTLYLFWRFRDDGAVGQEENLFYSTSTDGVTWTPKVRFWQTNKTVMQLVSPSLIFEENRWIMYAVDIVPSPNTVVRLETGSVDPETPWTTPQVITTGASPAGKEPWHLYVLKFGGRYYMLRADCVKDANGTAPDLLFLVSSDGYTFTGSGTSVIPSVQAGLHDQLYRATFVPAIENGIFGFRVWYTGWTTSPQVWNIFRTFISAQGDGVWQNVPLSAGWTAYVGGGGYYTGGLRYKRVGKTVTLEGTVKSGAAGSVIAVLPPEARPASTFFPVVNAGGAVSMLQLFGASATSPDTGVLKYFTGAASPSYLPINVTYQTS